MKKVILVLLFSLQSLLAFSQAPNWLWAKRGGGNTDVYSTGICSDAFGNTYISGVLTGYTTFGSLALSTSTGADVFVVKYDSAGNALWAKRSVTSTCNATSCSAMTIDSKGNVYITGYFACNISFGSFSLVPGPGGGATAFVVKYDPSGTVLWARRAAGTVYGNVEANSITADATGNVYIVCNAESVNDVVFGTDTVHGTGYNNAFIAKYDSSGNVIWAQSPPLTGFSYNNSIHTDLFNGLYVTGSYKGTITFGNQILTQDTIDRVFFAKYDTGGNVIWAKDFGGDTASAGVSVCSDMSGNVYLTGSFTCDTLTIDGTTLINDTTNKTQDIFLAKFDSSGNAQWAKRIGNGYNDYAPALYADALGNVYITGTEGAPSYNYYFFMNEYDTNGNLLWSNAGSNSEDKGNALFVDANGNGYITGYIGTSITLGGTTLTNGSGGVDLFVAKFNNHTGNGNCSAYFNLYPDVNPHSYIISNMSVGASSYSWNWGDGTPADTGSTPSHVYAQTGFYTICLSITGPNACSDSHCYSFNLQKNSNSMIYVNVQQGGVGVEGFNTNPFLSVYPNPSSSDLIIESSTKLETITISNSLGEVVFKANTSEFKYQADISKLSKGIYIVNVGSKNQKLVKE